MRSRFRKRWQTHANLTSHLLTPQKLVASSTAYSDTKCHPCCGVASTVVCQRVAYRAQLFASSLNVNGNASNLFLLTTSLLRQLQTPRLRLLQNCFQSMELALQPVKTSLNKVLSTQMSPFLLQHVALKSQQASTKLILLFAPLTKSHTVHHRSLHLLPAHCSKKLAVNCVCLAAK